MLNAAQAQDAIAVIDKAIEEVNSNRGEMGAFQKNNLESNLNYLRIAHENTVSSESVIRDADMANEMAKFTRDKIMTEASTAMLAQANQSSTTVMKLLGWLFLIYFYRKRFSRMIYWETFSQNKKRNYWNKNSLYIMIQKSMNSRFVLRADALICLIIIFKSSQ